MITNFYVKYFLLGTHYMEILTTVEYCLYSAGPEEGIVFEFSIFDETLHFLQSFVTVCC